MIIRGHCEACKGAIEFEDTLRGSQSICPLCEKEIMLFSDEERRRRNRQKQDELKAAKRAEHEKKLREQQAKLQEQAKQAHRQRLRAIMTPSEFAGWIIGWIVIVVSSVMLVVKFSSDITAYGSETVNMSLMHYRETGIIVGCTGEVVGTLLLVVACIQCAIHNQRSYHFREVDN